MKRPLLDRLLAARAARTPVAMVTDMGTGQQTLVFPDAVHGAFAPDAERLAAVRTMLAEDRSGLIGDEDEDVRLFVNVFAPPLRLIVVGAVHIAQSLVPMAGLAGFAVTVVDPRSAFATPERFPGVALVHDWPDDALAALAPDSRTAVVTLTHDPKLDDPALKTALPSAAFYVGALGSRRTHTLRCERLRTDGVNDEALARLHAPVGLRIGAVTGAEIAVSILAEVIATRRGTAPARP
ncbi:XdhC family protein [Azospirillum halopraeferens]|uniref:XdhC family protein n=1 Tax=Azospirillum halopraeferens TaxID=34010 RepID=UPI0004137AE0|nr:XdhC family protein [Azospirillum halopraeferens]